MRSTVPATVSLLSRTAQKTTRKSHVAVNAENEAKKASRAWEALPEWMDLKERNFHWSFFSFINPGAHFLCLRTSQGLEDNSIFNSNKRWKGTKGKWWKSRWNWKKRSPRSSRVSSSSLSKRLINFFQIDFQMTLEARSELMATMVSQEKGENLVCPDMQVIWSTSK